MSDNFQVSSQDNRKVSVFLTCWVWICFRCRILTRIIRPESVKVRNCDIFHLFHLFLLLVNVIHIFQGMQGSCNEILSFRVLSFIRRKLGKIFRNIEFCLHKLSVAVWGSSCSIFNFRNILGVFIKACF